MQTKPFIVANVREVLDQYDSEEISFSKMVEMLNEIAEKFTSEKIKLESNKLSGVVEELSNQVALATKRVNDERYELLYCLCLMWGQYCSGEYGHLFMTAGEETMEVLEKYDLLKNTTICAGEVDFEKLKEYEPK